MPAKRHSIPAVRAAGGAPGQDYPHKQQMVPPAARLLPFCHPALLSRRLPAGFVTPLTAVTSREASAENFDKPPPRQPERSSEVSRLTSEVPDFRPTCNRTGSGAWLFG